MTYEEICEALRQFARTAHPSAPPVRLRLYYADGSDDRFSIPPAQAVSAQPLTTATAHTATARVAPTTKGSDWDEVQTAIYMLIADSATRLTGGMVVANLTEQHRDEPLFTAKTISQRLAEFVKDGPLFNHPKDPKDGLGRGYGLPEWEKEDRSQ